MKSNRYETIQEIQSNAVEGTVIKDITYQQAFSIMIRNEQLRYEGRSRTRATEDEKKRQIEKCWETRKVATED
jgi:hypothetical protein